MQISVKSIPGRGNNQCCIPNTGTFQYVEGTSSPEASVAGVAGGGSERLDKQQERLESGWGGGDQACQ